MLSHGPVYGVYGFAMAADPECEFCRIVAGRAPARVVARFEGAVAFLPLRPAVAGHTLVVPHRHVTSPVEMDAATGHALSDAVVAVARRVDTVLCPEGLNVVQSTGAVASQTVPHLHVHVVPRSSGDGLPVLWPPGRDWAPQELDRMAASLRTAGRSAEGGAEQGEADGNDGQDDRNGQHRA
jgi:histidine triad (HIT) family protein